VAIDFTKSLSGKERKMYNGPTTANQLEDGGNGLKQKLWQI
jgi:hypothetical protein